MFASYAWTRSRGRREKESGGMSRYDNPHPTPTLPMRPLLLGPRHRTVEVRYLLVGLVILLAAGGGYLAARFRSSSPILVATP